MQFLSGHFLQLEDSTVDQKSPPRFFGSHVWDNVRLVSVELSGVDADEKGEIRINKGARATVVCEYTVGEGESQKTYTPLPCPPSPSDGGPAGTRGIWKETESLTNPVVFI
jgi:hypothetical protein